MEIVVFGPFKRTGSLHGESVVDLSQLGREIVGPDGELIYPERCNKPTKPLPIYLARNRWFESIFLQRRVTNELSGCQERLSILFHRNVATCDVALHEVWCIAGA